jgi:hypothetical protein
LTPVAVLATVMTLERTKLRAMVLHWTRPTRLALRAAMSRVVYSGRAIKRLPGLALRIARAGIRRLVLKPVFWLVNRSKLALHAVLVWRNEVARPAASDTGETARLSRDAEPEQDKTVGTLRRESDAVEVTRSS